VEKVLLAIEGVAPRHRVFRYAAELCSRIKAELSILQVIRLGSGVRVRLKGLQDKASRARRSMEDSMSAVAFAEAGQHEAAMELSSRATENLSPLVTQAEKEGVPCHVTLRTGEPGKEIIRYLKVHRDVVVTVYDMDMEGETPLPSRPKRCAVPAGIMAEMPVPLVVPGHSYQTP
jgi:hypothetical protein